MCCRFFLATSSWNSQPDPYLQMMILLTFYSSLAGLSASVSSGRINHPAVTFCCYTTWPQSPQAQLTSFRFSLWRVSMEMVLGRGWMALPLETNLRSFLRQIVTMFKLGIKYHLFRLYVKLTFAALRTLSHQAECGLPDKTFIQIPQNVERLPVLMLLIPPANHSTMLVECDRQ